MELYLRSSIVAMVLFSSLLEQVKCLDERNFTCSFASVKSPYLRLRKHLFCDYDTSVRPVKHHHNVTNVTIIFTPLRMDFTDESSKFILHAWTTWMWKDEFLTWNIKEFDKIFETYVKSTEIWIPDFTPYNSADLIESQIGIPSANCILSNNGFLSCSAPVKYNVHCNADVKYWPYDEQSCIVRVSSWAHSSSDVGIHFDQSKILMDHYNKNNEWEVTKHILKKITEHYNCCPDQHYLVLAPTFFLRRHPSMLHTIFVTPAFVFIILSSIILYLDTESNERILLAAVNFVCHILFICSLHWVIPQNGKAGSPNLLLFYRDSWIISTFTLVLTMLLRKLLSIRYILPNWMIFAVSLIENNKAFRFLLLDEASNDFSDIKQTVSTSRSAPLGVDEGNSESPGKNSLKKVVKIIERFIFICTGFAYLLLVILLIPRA